MFGVYHWKLYHEVEWFGTPYKYGLIVINATKLDYDIVCSANYRNTCKSYDYATNSLQLILTENHIAEDILHIKYISDQPRDFSPYSLLIAIKLLLNWRARV